MPNIMVTGCTGFIGSNLAKQLVERGDTVYGLVRHTTRAGLESLGPILSRMRFVEGDLTDYHSVVSAIEGANPDYVVHLGALTPVRLSYENPFAFLRVNFLGTCNVVHAIHDVSPKTDSYTRLLRRFTDGSARYRSRKLQCLDRPRHTAYRNLQPINTCRWQARCSV
mgnify:CR=1 FL=1